MVSPHLLYFNSTKARNYLGIISELSRNYSREGDRVPGAKSTVSLTQNTTFGLGIISELSRHYLGIILELLVAGRCQELQLQTPLPHAPGVRMT